MELGAYRQRRAAQALRQVQLARSTVREQRSDIARVVSSWNRIAKRINRAIGRYNLSVEQLDVPNVERLEPVLLLECLKGCVGDYQTGPLDALEVALKENERVIKAAARKRTRKLQRRAARSL